MNETCKMVKYQCNAQRIAHFPLNIGSGQESEHIFLKQTEGCIVNADLCYEFDAQRIAHFPLFICLGQKNEYIFL